MKKFVYFSFWIILLLVVLILQGNIVDQIMGYVENEDMYPSYVIESNEYKSNFDFMYVKSTSEAKVTSKDDIKRVYYSFINSGLTTLTVYCDKEYVNCSSDASEVSKDDSFLNVINNYVHPYNSYKYIQSDIYNNKIVMTLTHNYSNEMIYDINNRVDQIISENINSNMSTRDKIKTIHDYIINHTRYDKGKEEYSTSAYRTLFEGISTCGGYTDLMSIFLYKLRIPNYKINTEKHIWNYVFVDGKWYHLDLTWDDPITNTGEDYLSHDYFLVDNQTLKRLNDDEHNYNPDLYLETKN